MRSHSTSVPFRWDVRRREALGGLLEGERAAAYEGFANDLLQACAKSVGAAGDSDLVFVGRSPESLFDHLSGLLEETSWRGRLRLLQYSGRGPVGAQVRAHNPSATRYLREYWADAGLHPSEIARRRRPVAFVDLVCRGGTFEQIIERLRHWAHDTKVPWNDVRRKIRLVALCARTKNSPNTWRWFQHAPWLSLLPRGAVASASLGPELWYFLAENQLKVTQTYPARFWGHEENTRPTRHETNLAALRVASDLVASGRNPRARTDFASLLAEERAVREPWMRALIQELRT